MLSQCANPDCTATFDYHQGRLLCFHKHHAAAAPPANSHSVQHFWLCHSCDELFTLVYDRDRGVTLVPRMLDSIKAAPRRVIAAA